MSDKMMDKIIYLFLKKSISYNRDIYKVKYDTLDLK